MKILKRLLQLVVALIVILLIVALFVKKDYAVSRDITIDRSDSTVFAYIKFVKNQDSFSVWNMRDPNMIKTYSGNDGTIGFVYGWKSMKKDVGAGEQKIISIDPNKELKTELHFVVPFDDRDTAYIRTESIAPNQTKVTWGFYGRFKYPMNLFNLCVNMDKEVGTDLQGGLANLKKQLEK